MFHKFESIMKVLKNYKLPGSYKAAILAEANVPLTVEERKIAKLKKGEVWIKMQAAPINPSDLVMLTGEYPHKKTYPYAPGLEGSGLVVASGGGFMANYMLGKRVACSSSEKGDGTWAEYMKVYASNCIPLNSALDFEQGASALVNPSTALALLERVEQGEHKSFINTAAGGALGKMIIKLAKHKNLLCISIVHREAQVQELKALGADVVLNSSDEDFEEQLKQVYAKHNTQIILDAVGGEFCNTLIEPAPDDTTLVSYGSLVKEALQVNPILIIRFGKKVEGFHLAKWFSEQSKLKLLKFTRQTQKLMAQGILDCSFSQKFPIEDVNEAIKNYSQNMTKGKNLLLFK